MPKDLTARAQALAKATAPVYKAKNYVDLKDEDWKTVLSVLLSLDDEGRREYLNHLVKRSNSGGTVKNGAVSVSTRNPTSVAQAYLSMQLGFMPWLLNQTDHWIWSPFITAHSSQTITCNSNAN
jgi:hypothetical protein